MQSCQNTRTMTDSPQPKITTQWSTQISPIEQSHPPRQLQSFYPPSAKSPGIRHPLTRPLSPDLPTKDALYLFSNFASYMRSPPEGAEGIRNSEDFRDTVRLLDYARVGHTTCCDGPTLTGRVSLRRPRRMSMSCISSTAFPTLMPTPREVYMRLVITSARQITATRLDGIAIPFHSHSAPCMTRWSR